MLVTIILVVDNLLTIVMFGFFKFRWLRVNIMLNVFQTMADYTAEELAEMQLHIEYLGNFLRRRGCRPAAERGSLPEAWREFLRINSRDQYSMGLFIYYIVAFWNK